MVRKALAKILMADIEGTTKCKYGNFGEMKCEVLANRAYISKSEI